MEVNRVDNYFNQVGNKTPTKPAKISEAFRIFAIEKLKDDIAKCNVELDKLKRRE